jgi:hypothetical protein
MVKGKVVPVLNYLSTTPRRRMRGVDVYTHVFLTSALVAGVVSFTLRPFYPGERAPGTHWIGGWVGPRADLSDMQK